MKSWQIGLKILSSISIAGYLMPAQAQVLNRPDFFQQGFDKMQREINQLQQSPQPQDPSQLLTIKEDTLKWQKFIFQTVNFSVWMPQGPQSQEALSLETTLGKISFDVLATHPQPWRFVAAFSEDLGSLTTTQNPEAILASVLQGITGKTQFNLTDDQPVNFRSFSGRRWTLESEQESIQFQAYLIKQRLYVLAVHYPKSMVTSGSPVPAIVDAFFNSFTLL
jgi:hypothetical protein